MSFPIYNGAIACYAWRSQAEGSTVDLRVTLRDGHIKEYQTIILANQPSRRHRDVVAVVRKIEDLEVVDPFVVAIVKISD